MGERIVHLCYAGTSGSARAAINIAAGSAEPTRHAYVLYGSCEVRGDYARQLDDLGSPWRYVHKPRGLLTRAYRRVAEALIEMADRIVVCHGSRSLPVAANIPRLAPGVKLVAVQHGPSSELTSWSRRAVCERFSRLADRTVTVSAGMAELVGRRLRLLAGSGPLAVIVNGVDVDYWAAPPPAITPDAPIRLVIVATFSPHKGHADLLYAVRQLRHRGRDVAACLVGSGPEEPLIRRLLRRLDLAGEVTFTGDLDRDGVRRAIHDAHVLVHPSHSESFGMSVLEAMAASRCVVAADCVGVRELIRHEQTGLLAPPGDVDAIASAIERLAEDADLAGRLAAAARQEAVGTYSHRQMALQYEHVVDTLLAGRGN